MKTLPKVTVPVEIYERLKALTAEVVGSAQASFSDGVVYWCPDGERHYDGVWLRDLCYAAEGAGDLMPSEVLLALVDLFLSHQREDGTIPTRVMADGVPDYFEGPREAPIGSRPPADNPAFLAKLLVNYVERTGDWSALDQRLDAVAQAFDSVPHDRAGLVLIDPNAPSSGYGFTDCIAKTGKEFFSSLLRWEACRRLAEACRLAEMHEEAHEWYEKAEPLEGALAEFFDAEQGMFVAATVDCRQMDVWGSSYACVIGAITSKQRRAVTDWLAAYESRWGWHGHVRHLPRGEYWQRLLKPVAPDTYQNGGYWAVPTGWVAQVLFTRDKQAGRAVIAQVLEEFEQHGVMEWIHPDKGRHVAGYVASVCNVLGAVAPSRKLDPASWPPGQEVGE